MKKRLSSFFVIARTGETERSAFASYFSFFTPDLVVTIRTKDFVSARQTSAKGMIQQAAKIRNMPMSFPVQATPMA